ncbi:MAG: MFS transporter [Rubricoccaceae bacterium]|nr:MFS transporter [Rubricoccaceae bacterium]
MAASPSEQRWTLAVAVLGSSLAFLVSSVVNVALPAIQRDLGASAPTMQWVVNAYLLFLGALLLAGGAAGDRYGERRVFGWGLAVFAFATLGCALAPSSALLIGARAVQGVGAALLVPVSLALLTAVFPPGERGRAVGTWAGFSALTTAFGPALGGWLVDVLSWRAVFWPLVPLALLTLGLSRKVPETHPSEEGPLDKLGALLATVGLGGLAAGLIRAGERGWTDGLVLAGLGGGAVLLVLFVFQERRAEAPLLPLGLFRSRVFTGANLLTLALYFALYGALFFLPFHLIQVQGMTAAEAGLAFLPFSLVMASLSRWAGGLLDRVGARLPLTVGPLLVAAGFVLLMRPGVEANYWTTFFPALLVIGIGMATAVAPLTTVVLNAAPDEHAGAASGVNNAAARVAGLLAVAVLGVVALTVFEPALASRLASLDAPAATRDAVWAARADLAAAADAVDGAPAVVAAVGAAFVAAFRLVAGLCAGLAALAAAFAWVLLRDGPTDRAGPRRVDGPS